MGAKNNQKNRDVISKKPVSVLPGCFIKPVTLLVVITGPLLSCGGGSSDRSLPYECPGETTPPYEMLLDPSSTGPLVATHRGAHNHVPENSLASIREAASLGADFAEVDINNTLDGVLVLMHDSNLSRTTGFNTELSSTTYTQIKALTLLNSNPADPETMNVPTFAEALALARETGIMLYVDIKTNRDDLVAADIQSGSYHDVALLHTSTEQALQMQALDANLLFMPSAQTIEDLNAVLEAMPGIRIVELDKDSPDAEFCAAARREGIKVQQDVTGWADNVAALGDYREWAKFVYTGVWLLQTDQPELLIPAACEYRQTGIFP